MLGCIELSLTVPITNSLAFLFTVLGDWWADGKVISRGKCLLLPKKNKVDDVSQIHGLAWPSSWGVSHYVYSLKHERRIETGMKTFIANLHTRFISI